MRFLARAGGDTEKKKPLKASAHHSKWWAEDKYGGSPEGRVRSSVLSTKGKGECCLKGARFQAVAEFSSLADSQGSNSAEEARDMADD